MRVHHLNCGCMCPLGGAWFDGYSRGLTASLPCHCLLIETERSGLMLVDTGFGQQDVQHPQRLSRMFRVMNNIRLEHRFTAVGQIRRLGLDPEDVRHILLTHLDFDHAGGLSDFPGARVHVMAAERHQAEGAPGWLDRRRFSAPQWRDVQNWQLYLPQGDKWFGFDSVRAVIGAEQEDVLLVPLPGHTEGHAGIAVRTAEGWKLHAGDAYFHHDEVHAAERWCPPGKRLYQRLMDTQRPLRFYNQRRLRDLARDQQGAMEIFCSHDLAELQRAQAVSDDATRWQAGGEAACASP